MKSEHGQGLVEYAVPIGFLLCVILIAISIFMPGLVEGIDMVLTAAIDIDTSIRTEGVMVTFDKYKDIPLTKHAKESHADEKWNAATIQEAFDANKCTPSVTLCNTRDYHYCEIEPGVAIGLVIGGKAKNNEVVVTGFQSTEVDYWQNCGDPP